MSIAQPLPLAIPLTMRSSAAASNLIFLPPPHLLTTLCRLRLNSSVPFHGPSCPSPSRPTPARICHLSPVIRSARPTCRTVRSTPPPGYPYCTPLTSDTYSLHSHFATLVHFAPYRPHSLRRLSYWPRPISYFRPILTTPIFLVSPRRAYPPRRPSPPLRSQCRRMCACVCH